MNIRLLRALGTSLPGFALPVLTLLVLALLVLAPMSGCTQETQNKISRGLQNWTGTNGVLEIYSGGKLVRRFIRIDKLSTATGTDDGAIRPYRYGYGYPDLNFNFEVDDNEKRKVYFEISSYSTPYVFFENPN